VLFRQEEADMRRKLIDADVIECVLGLGPNLFYNSPMEACVVCRMAKAKERRNKILFINAVNEVTRERAQSFLTDDHIGRIVKAYEAFKDEPGFTRAVGLEEIRARDGNLSIPLYVSAPDANGQVQISAHGSLPDSLSAWLSSASDVRAALVTILGTDALKETCALSGKPAQALPAWIKRNEWKRLPFGEFAQNVNERVEPSQASDEIYVGLEHLDPQDLHIRRWGKGSDVIGTKLRFRQGDLIFGRRRAYQRKLAVAEFDGICSAHAMVVRAKPAVVLPEFLPFLMMSDRFMNRAIEISVGSLSPTINWTTLKLEEFALPPLDQQRRIAAILWAVDEMLTCSDKLVTNLNAYATVAVREALSIGVPAGKAKAKLPAWWHQRLGEVCDLQNGRGFAAAEWSQQGLPIIRIQNLNGSRDFNYFDGKPDASWIVEPGTLLFAWAGVRGVSFGPCIWQGPLGVLNQHIYRIVPKDGVSKRWLYETLRVITADIEKKAHGFKIELVHVRKGDITAQVVPVPPQSEQQEIAEYAELLEAAEGGAVKQAARVRELRSAFLNRIFDERTP
jgi:hypothetical protein